MFATKDWEKKKQYWMKKQNIGILAKMVTHPSRVKAFKLTPLDASMHIPPKDLEALWMKLLLAKFSIEPFKKLLLETKELYLAEYSARAKPHDIYTCKVNKETRALIGENVMGLLLMRVRKHLAQELKQEEKENSNK